MKALSKKIGVTINDIVTSAISTSFSTLFKKNKDLSTSLMMLIPANIRFKFYPTREQVKLENKITVMPLKIPVVDNMENAYP